MGGRETNRIYEGAKAYADYLESNVLPDVVGTPNEECTRLAIHVNRSESQTLRDVVHDPTASPYGDADDVDF